MQGDELLGLGVVAGGDHDLMAALAQASMIGPSTSTCAGALMSAQIYTWSGSDRCC